MKTTVRLRNGFSNPQPYKFPLIWSLRILAMPRLYSFTLYLLTQCTPLMVLVRNSSSPVNKSSRESGVLLYLIPLLSITASRCSLITPATQPSVVGGVKISPPFTKNKLLSMVSIILLLELRRRQSSNSCAFL